jgi:hypothetical protein
MAIVDFTAPLLRVTQMGASASDLANLVVGFAPVL